MLIDMKQLHHNLHVWKIAHQFALRVYSVTNDFPTSERYGIISQLRRAVISIPTNIVEGQSRGSSADFRRFLIIARGSTAEVIYLLEFSKGMSLLAPDLADRLMQEATHIRFTLNKLIKSLNQK